MKIAVLWDVMLCSLVDFTDGSEEYAASIFRISEYAMNDKIILFSTNSTSNSIILYSVWIYGM
jgi:hypothetical protein